MKYSDLNIKRNNYTKEIDFNGCTIQVNQHIPLEVQQAIVADAINLSIADSDKIYNYISFETHLRLGIVANCTDIEFSDKELADTVNVYNDMESVGLIDIIIKALPSGLYEKLRKLGFDTMKASYEYRYSVYGILDSMQDEYNDLSLEADDIKKKVDEIDLTTAKEILDKLN